MQSSFLLHLTQNQDTLVLQVQQWKLEGRKQSVACWCLSKRILMASSLIFNNLFLFIQRYITQRFKGWQIEETKGRTKSKETQFCIQCSLKLNSCKDPFFWVLLERHLLKFPNLESFLQTSIMENFWIQTSTK